MTDPDTRERDELARAIDAEFRAISPSLAVSAANAMRTAALRVAGERLAAKDAEIERLRIRLACEESEAAHLREEIAEQDRRIEKALWLVDNISRGWASASDLTILRAALTAPAPSHPTPEEP